MILNFFDEFLFQNDKVAKTDDKCCQKQDLINDNWMNVCLYAVKSLLKTLRVLSFKLKKNKKISLPKVLNNTIDKY